MPHRELNRNRKTGPEQCQYEQDSQGGTISTLDLTEEWLLYAKIVY
jgi:hypothetical protein